MARPLDATPGRDLALRGTAGVRAEGERASARALVQSSVAVHQAAIVALARDVRPPEAHDAAAAQYAGAARYRYARDPSGAPRIVGGEVLVDATPVKGDPEATLQKLLQVRQVALTPPTSPEDIEIANAATRRMQQAQLALASRRYREAAARSETADPPAPAKPAEPPVSEARAGLGGPAAPEPDGGARETPDDGAPPLPVPAQGSPALLRTSQWEPSAIEATSAHAQEGSTGETWRSAAT